MSVPSSHMEPHVAGLLFSGVDKPRSLLLKEDYQLTHGVELPDLTGLEEQVLPLEEITRKHLVHETTL